MSTYRAPMQEIQFVMNELAGLEQVGKLPGYEDATPDTVTAILEEASKFATEVLDPLNAVVRNTAARACRNWWQPRSRKCGTARTWPLRCARC